MFKQNGNEYLYFTETDHLGSIIGLLNADGTYAERFSYDAWGRRRNPTDWSYNNVPAPVLIDRGFTGHEHLDVFGLINMNGRVYDPVLGRFLGVDPVIQDPYNSQNYNGYSYCLNNPLSYSDPSGYVYHSGSISPDGEEDNNYLALNGYSPNDPWLNPENLTWDEFYARMWRGNEGLFNNTKRRGGGGNNLEFDDDEYTTVIIEGVEHRVRKSDLTCIYNSSNNAWKRPWHYLSDYTKFGLAIGQSNGKYSNPTEWVESLPGSYLVSGTAGLISGYFASIFGSTKVAAMITALTSGLGVSNFRYETRRIDFIVDQVTWYGTITSNIFTGKILGVNSAGTVTTQVSMGNHTIYEERIIFIPTNEVVMTWSHKPRSTWHGFCKPTPTVGLIYQSGN